MEIKTFEAFTMKDAVKKVKDSFGHDAVILETKTKPSGNGRGLLYEVTAAPSSESFTDSASTRIQPPKSGQAIDKSDLIQWQRQLNAFEEKLEHIYSKSIRREHLISIESGLQEVRTVLLDYLSHQKSSSFKDAPEAIQNIIKRLKVMNLDEDIISQVAKHLCSIPNEKRHYEDSYEFYQGHCIRWMMKRTKVSPRWNLIDGETQVHTIIGPSGVGKSSLVCKLAAEYHLKEKRQVLIVSFDNHRLGSAEQMRLYTKVLGTPFETISRVEDLARVVEKNSNMDLILVDTAGRSPKATDAIDEISKLKSDSYTHHFHLALSMTDQKSQIERSIRSFMQLGISSVMFTKMDESWTYGEVFNAMHKWGIPISWFGVGQNIPEDLERASRERLVERIIGL
ncbi:hypothetical protein [Pseudobacteriovorax antillogorgiicola]|uniref:Flagellar biosynthesis protein FlhF n=1 Tax=Pseudobacteriovorax antillogorgiicola TaxID=1513793 RepID=A0A1Y6CNG6_9BACT|nr:hypothetical protein [Pseudobacteriovorax antillogorgiicola]TCS46655.1 flagellar biosynthesis GTPase FlhF [Pseudobacteriovorax antillogorgiicola]SMF66426.1 Flagellar biosynthesis GTPase FlhF [Pseudobacteriovorax antillogorgiicola]